MDELAWNGIRSGAAQYGAEATYLVATRSGQRGPEPHLVEQDLQKFVSAGCDLIATAGFTVGDAAATTAKANPTRKFLILDFDYDPPIENVSAYLYATDQAAFLAGYVAAAVTKTGRVGTFGGFQMPPVEAYMDGFALGVAHYNQKRGASRRVLGWDVASRTGYFANDFVVEARGAEVTSRLLAEGADIVFPVAGLASLGALDPVLSRPGRYVIGVDTDWVEAYPDKASVILTSVEKRFNLSAISAIKALAEGRHEGRTRIGTIANGEVGIAPFHQLESLVSEDVRDDLGQIKTDIITGKIRTRP
jgi:basic membrane protein A